jgi:tetratricopeptide (TPR) repeat protein
MKTSLSTFFTVLLVDTLLRSEGRSATLLVASGVVFGLNALVRDNFILFLPLLLLVIPFSFGRARAGWRACALFTLGVATIVAPVTVRNFVVGHEFALLTAGGGSVFYIGNNPEATGAFTPPGFVHSQPMKEHEDFIAKASELTGRPLTAGESSSFWLRQGLTWIAGHPLAWARLLVWKLVIFWNYFELPDNYNYYEVRQVLLEPLGAIGFILAVPLYVMTFALIAPLGLTGILLTAPRWRSFVLIYAVLFGYMGTVLLFFNFARFRVPIVPFLCIFAAATLASMERAIRKEAPGREPSWLVAGPVLLAVAWFVNSVGNVGTGVWADVQLCLRLGNTYRTEGRIDDAAAQYRKGLQLIGDQPIDGATLGALRVDPNQVRRDIENERRAQAANFATVRAGLHLGVGLIALDEAKKVLASDRGRAQGFLQHGIEELEQTVKLVPTTPALRRLGQAYSLSGRRTEAEKAYRDAIALEPDDFGSRYDLAGILYETKRWPEALVEMQAIGRSGRTLDASELSDYHYGMGIVRLEGFGDRERALYHFEKALEAKPDHNRKAHMEKVIAEFTAAGVRPVADD